jgi:hypothetical protein
MQGLAKRFWSDEAGVVISAELVLILTVAVLGILVGLVEVRNAIVGELTDLGLAFSHLNQSYAFAGLSNWKGWGSCFSWIAGSSFIDVYEGSGVIVGDIGTTYGYGGAFAENYGYHTGTGCGGCGVATCGCTVYGTIILADNTLIPIALVASGTWALPGGAVLAATSSHAHFLLLADGTTIPFVFGHPGIVEFEDGKILAVRPNGCGTWVLSDGRKISFDAEQDDIVLLEDGTKLKFTLVKPDSVILPDTAVVVVKAGAAGTLVLPEGRLLDLHDAILPSSVDCNLAPSVPCRMLPPVAAPCGPGCPEGPIETFVPPIPIHGVLPPHGGLGVQPKAAPLCCPKPIVPQGPAPQFLPQI